MSPEIMEQKQQKRFGGSEVDSLLGIVPDYKNAWMGLNYVVAAWDEHRELALRQLHRLTPLRTYEEYLSHKEGSAAGVVISQSDPKIRQQINALVIRFNQELEEIKASQNIPRIIEYINSFNALCNGMLVTDNEKAA